MLCGFSSHLDAYHACMYELLGINLKANPFRHVLFSCLLFILEFNEKPLSKLRQVETLFEASCIR